MTTTDRPPLRLVPATPLAGSSGSLVENEDTHPDGARQTADGAFVDAKTAPASTAYQSGERAASSAGVSTPAAAPVEPRASAASEASSPARAFDPDDRSPVLKPGDIVGGLEIVRRVACGGMGEVYEAYHPHMQQHLAVKVMLRSFHGRPEWVERFCEEGRMLAAFSQKELHMVQIRDVGKDPKCGPYISMEWLVGKNLREMLSGWGGAMPLQQSVLLVISICDITNRLHKLGLVHRDLKPENIFLEATNPPRIKLLDLGIAKRAGAERTTEENKNLGTLEYMSPEQINGGRATASSDQYAIAHILYEMLSGGHAFKERMDSAYLDGGIAQRNLILMSSHLLLGCDPLDADLAPTIKVDRKTELSLSVIVARAMSRDPKDRYPTLAELADDLRRWLVAHRTLRPSDTGELTLDFSTLMSSAPRSAADSVARVVPDEEPADPASPASPSPSVSLRKGDGERIEKVELTDFLHVYSLLVESDAEDRGRYPLAREVVVIGREGGKADLVLADATVSRMHCELRHVSTGVFQVVDLGSVHGLRFGEFEARSGILREGEVMSLGQTKLRLLGQGGFKKTGQGLTFVTNFQTLSPGERATMRMMPIGGSPGGPLLDIEHIVPTVAKPNARKMALAASPARSWGWTVWAVLAILVGLSAVALLRVFGPYGETHAPASVEPTEASPAATNARPAQPSVATPQATVPAPAAATAANAPAAKPAPPAASTPAPKPPAALPRPVAPPAAPVPASTRFEPEAL